MFDKFEQDLLRHPLFDKDEFKRNPKPEDFDNDEFFKVEKP